MAENIELMLEHIRPYNEKTDADLEKFSHSKLECFEHCPRNFMFKYRYHNYLMTDSIATAIGSIVHKVLELKGIYKMNHQEVDYDYLKDVLMNGYEDENEKLIGVNKIKIDFMDDWEDFDEKSMLYYDEKIEIFLESVLPNEMEDAEWAVIGTEVPFLFVYNDKYAIRGYIDRLDGKYDKNGNLIDVRVIDYKTSKKVFDRSYIVSSQQFTLYSMAVYLMYGMLPSEHIYRFALIDETQSENVCTSGYVGRVIKKLDKVFDTIQNDDDIGTYEPKATPLCAFCDFSETNRNATEPYNTYCPYHSLWTPQCRVFAVNQEYSPEDDMEI